MTPQETEPDLPVSVQDSLAEAWVGGGLLQGWGHLSVAVHAWDLLKDVTIIFITSTIVCPQVNNREGTQPHPSTKSWIKDLLSWPCPSEQDPVSPSVSLSHQEAYASLLSVSIRGQTDENHNHRTLTNLITWTTALSNSMKL